VQIGDGDITTGFETLSQMPNQRTRQEMRSVVCRQCHVEYHFEGPEKRLTYPWNRGLRADSIRDEFQRNGHVDWTYARVGTMRIGSHHLRSPMPYIKRSYQTCHRQSEGEFLEGVTITQDRTYQTRGIDVVGLLDLVRDGQGALRAVLRP